MKRSGRVTLLLAVMTLFTILYSHIRTRLITRDMIEEPVAQILPVSLSFPSQYYEPQANHTNSANKQGGLVAEYCNLPENMKIGAEGVAPFGYKLISVHAVIRHGNRVPINPTLSFGPLKFPQVKCTMNVSKSSMPDKLEAFINATNKPLQGATRWRFSLSPQSTYCRPAEITQIGVEQQLKIGQNLRWVYHEMLGNITQKDLKVVSTLQSRTYQSSVAFVFGLLDGDVDYEQLNIESTTSVVFCRKKSLRQCQNAQVLWQAGEKKLKELQYFDPYYTNFRNSMYESLGEQFNGTNLFYPWRTPHDMMISRLCGKIKLPCNNEHCFKESQADMSWRSQKFYHRGMSKNEDILLSAKLTMYPFLEELISRLTSHSYQSSHIDEVFSVYFGHDKTLVPLLLALELPIKQWPPFASRLVFELYKPDSYSTLKENVFKIIYDGEDMTGYLKFCPPSGDPFSRNRGCALEHLLSYYYNLLPQMNRFSYAEACRPSWFTSNSYR